MDRFRFNQGASGVIPVVVKDGTGAVVPNGDLTVATLTLWDVDTYELDSSPIAGIINDRFQQDILGVNLSPATLNDVTYGQDSIRWDVQPEDNIIITPRRQVERHRALFAFEFPTGEFTYECEIEVVNLRMQG